MCLLMLFFFLGKKLKFEIINEEHIMHKFPSLFQYDILHMQYDILKYSFVFNIFKKYAIFLYCILHMFTKIIIKK